MIAHSLPSAPPVRVTDQLAALDSRAGDDLGDLDGFDDSDGPIAIMVLMRGNAEERLWNYQAEQAYVEIRKLDPDYRAWERMTDAELDASRDAIETRWRTLDYLIARRTVAVRRFISIAACAVLVVGWQVVRRLELSRRGPPPEKPKLHGVIASATSP